LSSCSPRSANTMPDLATRSVTVRETSTSEGPASAATIAPMLTATPDRSSPRSLTSPVWLTQHDWASVYRAGSDGRKPSSPRALRAASTGRPSPDPMTAWRSAGLHAKGFFGDRVRGRRSERGLAQEALALKAGINRAYIGSLEAGQRNPSLETVAKLAIALKVDAADLVRGLQRCEAAPKRPSRRTVERPELQRCPPATVAPGLSLADQSWDPSWGRAVQIGGHVLSRVVDASEHGSYGSNGPGPRSRLLSAAAEARGLP
jgi:transcriptional regulator with XRE-family HTH domain